jgi:hypothetical protein
VYSVFVLLLLLHCFIFILVWLLCCVSRSSLYCNIPSDLCTLCLSCYYFYIVLSLYLYCYVVYLDHHFTVIYLQTCVLCVCLVITSTLFIFILVLLLWFVYRSSLYCNIPSDLCTLCLSCYYFYIVFIFILVSLLCHVSRSSLYCNIPSDLCTLCMSCYYFYIVLSLYLYCRYVVYLDHHFTVISLQTLRGRHGPNHMVVGFTTTYANQCLISSLIL